MKWIRTAVTVVIMIVSVGVIALGINNLTQSKGLKEEVVTFEVLTETTVTSGTYDNIILYAITHNDNTTNITSYKKNGIETDDSYSFSYDLIDIYLNWFDDVGDDTNIIISDDDTFINNSSLLPPIVSDTFEITFEVPQPPILTGTIAIILGLVPLIVASGVLYFMLRKNNIGD